MLTQRKLAQIPLDQLDQVYAELIVERMVMDKFFSVFLEENTLSEVDTTTDQWNTYKAKLAQYEILCRLIQTTQYYLNHGQQRPTRF